MKENTWISKMIEQKTLKRYTPKLVVNNGDFYHGKTKVDNHQLPKKL